MIVIQLLLTVFIVSSRQTEPAEFFHRVVKVPNCTCPDGVEHNWNWYCGYELKELNSKASEKVLQTSCEDYEAYECSQPKQISKLKKRCYFRCVVPSDKIKAKYKYLSAKSDSLRMRWCVDPPEPGR